MRIAFYKGRGRFWDWVVRIATFSRYSHVELVFENAGSPIWFSSSPRDGGVRFKRIEPKAGHWDFLPVPPGAVPDVQDFHNKALARIGDKYDWLGAFNAIFPWRKQDPDRWFCSEIVADMLGVPDPEKQTPKSLYQEMEREAGRRS